MAIKKLEDFQPAEIEGLEQAQYDTLVQDGQIDIPDAPDAEKKPGDKKETPAPEGEKEPGEKEPPKEPEKPPVQPEKKPEETLAEFQKRLADLEKANAGLREEVIRERHKRREAQAKPEEQSELVKRILALEDGAIVEAGTIKEGILADQKKADALKEAQEARIKQVEESKELAMAIHDGTDGKPAYEEAIQKGLPAYIASLPETRRERVLKTIAESVDPAELAYIYGSSGMSLVKKPEDVKPGNEVKPKPKEPEKEPPVILRGGKGGAPSATDKTLEELVFGGYTAEQLEKMAIEADKERNKGA